ncbi:MAG: glutamine--tRNA ligase, partial [Candidatus Latescibacterota bacterium]
DGRKVKGTLHWVCASHAVEAEVRQYENLFSTETPGLDSDYLEAINQNSFGALTGCMLEPALAKAPIGGTLQFERLGYYCADPDGTPEQPVFNRTVGLRDTWAKVQRQQAAPMKD